MKTFTIFLGFVAVVAIFVAVGLGLLLVQSNKQNSGLKTETVALESNNDATVESELQTDESSVVVDEKTTHFSDESMGFELDYPKSWELSTYLTMRDSTDAYDPAKKLSNFQVNLLKDSVKMNMFFLVSAYELYLSGINRADVNEIVELNSEFMRVNEDGNSWKYYRISECIPFMVEGDYCGEYFLQQTEDSVNFSVTVNDTSDSELQEVDKIFLSLFN